jgi:hypothetical protein
MKLPLTDENSRTFLSPQTTKAALARIVEVKGNSPCVRILNTQSKPHMPNVIRVESHSISIEKEQKKIYRSESNPPCPICRVTQPRIAIFVKTITPDK